MPLGLYLCEGKKEKKDRLISCSLSSKKISLIHELDALAACSKMGISFAPLSTSDSNIGYQSQVYSFAESVIYCSSSRAGWSMNGDLHLDGYGLSIFGKGYARWRMGKAVAMSSPHQGLIQDLDSLEEIACSEFSDACGIFFSREYLRKVLAMLTDAPIHERIRFLPTIPTHTYALNAIRGIIGIIASGLANDAPLRKAHIALTNLHQAATHLMLQELPHNYSERIARPAFSPAPRQIKRATEFISTNLAAPITLIEIAKAASISVRTLQVGFRKYKDTTPTEFIRLQRLYKVRDELLHASISPDVKEVALAWGFMNYYLFVKNYKRLFGESPLSTLSRRTEF